MQCVSSAWKCRECTSYSPFLFSFFSVPHRIAESGTAEARYVSTGGPPPPLPPGALPIPLADVHSSLMASPQTGGLGLPRPDTW